MKEEQHILFLQEFSMERMGGGVSIIRRLVEKAADFSYRVSIGCDVQANKGLPSLLRYQHSFYTLPRNIRYGIGALAARLTIFSLDYFALRSITRLIKTENPDVVHITAHGICFPLMVKAAKKAGKKIVLSVHDLWYFSVKGLVNEKQAEAIFKKAIRGIDTLYVISPEMRDYLLAACGPKNYQVIHDGINGLPFTAKNTLVGKLRLLYAGILHSMQVQQFNLLIDVLGSLSPQAFTIGICSATSFTPNRQYPNIEIINYGWIDEQRMKELSKDYLYGLLPLSFSAGDELFYRTSLMTKIPFYMGVGLPIICVGPASASAVKLIEREQTGVVIMAEDKAVIKDSIVRLMEQQETQYPVYLQHITQSAATTFNINLLAARFYTNLNN